MILSDKTLFEMIEADTLQISPLEKHQIQPASVDIRLGNTFSIVEDLPSGIINLEDEIPYKTIVTDTYILLPNQFVLATTMEYFHLPDDLTAFVEGRSSIELKAGRRIGQLVLAKMDSPAIHPYQGKYQGQKGATGSRVYLDMEKQR